EPGPPRGAGGHRRGHRKPRGRLQLHLHRPGDQHRADVPAPPAATHPGTAGAQHPPLLRPQPAAPPQDQRGFPVTEPAPPPPSIEVVDGDILARGASGGLLRAPGVALLESKGIATGDDAFRQAWLFPQRSYTQFWHQLNLAPLPAGNQYARHFADLAYAQLHHLHRALGAPGEVLFAIPGSFSRDQLAILLGLANALPVKTLGLVDAAVAAASGIGDYRGELLHLDIQLHQAVITRLRAGDTISRESVEILADAGLKHFHGGWAQYIANLFIREYRYDPLHTAEGEQQLFTKPPGWLDQLASRPETTVELDTPRGAFRLSLQRSGLVESSL